MKSEFSSAEEAFSNTRFVESVLAKINVTDWACHCKSKKKLYDHINLASHSKLAEKQFSDLLCKKCNAHKSRLAMIVKIVN